jgi:hypothetical protein
LQIFLHGLPWLVTAFGLIWILVPHPGIELEPTISLFIGVTLILAGLGLRLWGVREGSILNPSSNQPVLDVSAWPRLLMGLGLATSTGSIVIMGASLVAGIIWWLGKQTDTSEIQQRPASILHPIWSEAGLGVGMFLLALLAFSIRSQSPIF